MRDPGAAGRIEVVPYDPAWPGAYAAEARSLAALGGPALVAIEHIGSTAVPGLAAKPVIDMMAAVEEVRAAQALAASLEPLGYREVETGMRDRRLLRRQESGRGLAFHLHLVERAAWPRRHERIMRDHLREHPHLARAYAELKLRLAARFADDRAAYTQAKTGFVQALMDEACAARGLDRIDVWND